MKLNKIMSMLALLQINKNKAKKLIFRKLKNKKTANKTKGNLFFIILNKFFYYN